jgi:hypothetical protein
MKLLKAINKNLLGLVAVLEFDKPFNHTDFSLGILSLEKDGRSLYLDATRCSYDRNIMKVGLEYDEDILSPDVSKKADLKVQDLLLGLDEAKLYIGEDDYTLTSDIYLLVLGDDTELRIDLTID